MFGKSLKSWSFIRTVIYTLPVFTANKNFYAIMKNTKRFILLFVHWRRIISALVSLQVCWNEVIRRYDWYDIRSDSHAIFFSASREEVELYNKACHILLTYLITRLKIQNLDSNVDSNETTSPTLTFKQLLLPIKALCTATSQLQRTEQFALAALMKNAKLPHHIKTSMPSNYRFRCD